MLAVGLLELMPHVLVALNSLGMGLAFLIADRHSRTSQALAVMLAGIGISMGSNVALILSGLSSPQAAAFVGIPEAIAMIAFLEWILRVRQTVPSHELQVAVGDRVLRFGQGVAVLYALLALLFPELRSSEFIGALTGLAATLRPGFWLFMAPILLVALSGAASMFLLLNRRPDQPERVRIIAMMFAVPFLVSGFVLPWHYNAVPMVLGQIIFLVGAVQYHVLQGQRGQFMAQFLSPQVADLVRVRGLKQAMQENFLEISVVYADLRGYTAISESTASIRVIRLLRDYYEVVGHVVAEFGGTVKDQAGDGILILVGAPIEVPDHAQRALAMARKIRSAGAELKKRWAQEGIWLGLGLGVATGHVTVGVIGALSRLEYTAVGVPVNLAARLCQQAGDGEILVAERSIELAGQQASSAGLEVREPVALKGFSEPVGHFSLA